MQWQPARAYQPPVAARQSLERLAGLRREDGAQGGLERLADLHGGGLAVERRIVRRLPRGGSPADQVECDGADRVRCLRREGVVARVAERASQLLAGPGGRVT